MNITGGNQQNPTLQKPVGPNNIFSNKYVQLKKEKEWSKIKRCKKGINHFIVNRFVGDNNFKKLLWKTSVSTPNIGNVKILFFLEMIW